MSQSQEDYIKFMYEHSEGKSLSNKTISQGLGIAPPSVSEMMHRLASEELVVYEPYRGSQLSQKGTQMAQEIILKHEIWEYFLEHKLGYPVEEVHDLAEVLEHVTPKDLADRLAKYIEFPEKTTDQPLD